MVTERMHARPSKHAPGRKQKKKRPPPSERVKLLMERYEKGLDLMTGLPLEGRDWVEWNRCRLGLGEDDSPETMAMVDAIPGLRARELMAMAKAERAKRETG